MSLSICPTCFLQPATLLSTGLLALMARVVGVSLVSVGAVAVCIYLTFRVIFNVNSEPLQLVHYPTGGKLGERFEHFNTTQSTPCQPPLRTYGRFILNADGTRCKLVSANWYGASDEMFVPGGLDIQHRDKIATSIRDLGFNSVRLPYADEMVNKNPVISDDLLAANPDLIGSTALDVFHAVVNAMTDAGLAVVINNHITKARWCCDGNLCDAKWTNEYLGPFCPVKQTEEQWIQNLEKVSRPHVNNPLVIGIDLRNEIRGPSNGWLWSSWVNAAENAGERLHLLQPEWLIFVEGVCSSNILSRVKEHPVVLSTPHKVVYSAHVYGWSGWGTMRPYWNREYDSFASSMDSNWGYLLVQDLAPVWIAEIGAPDKPNKGDWNYWKNLVRYLEVMDADFGYWAVNPRKPSGNTVETYSLLEDDWNTPVLDYRMYDLSRLAVTKRRLSVPVTEQDLITEQEGLNELDDDSDDRESATSETDGQTTRLLRVQRGY